MADAPVEVPHANSVPSSGIEHRSRQIEGDLVYLAFALCEGYCAGGGAPTGVA